MIGDLAYMKGLIQSQLPSGWFADDAPVLAALIEAMATGSVLNFQQLGYVNAQSRVQTMTDRNLDIFALSYFGADRLYRQSDEEDDHYRARILRAMVLERGTRKGLIDGLTAISNVAPKLIEPNNPEDCGAYDVGFCGYDVEGAYATDKLPYQVFVTAYRPRGPTLPGAGGYGDLNPNMPGGYDVGAMEYIDDSVADIPMIDQEIIDTILDVIPAGVVAWVNIQAAPAAV